MKVQSQLPKWPLALLRFFCPVQLYEEIEGDLIQRFNRDVARVGVRRAKRIFMWNVIRFFRPGILVRNNLSLNLLSWYMIANYFKVALRFIFRNKTYSAINISGLAFGITGAMLLFLWIQREFNVDQFHADKERIYTAWNRTSTNGQLHCWPTTPRILAPTLKADYTAVESAVSFANYRDSYLFTAGETIISINNVFFTDPQFLTMFSFPLIKGNVSSALGNPNSIVLTESFAKKMFGDTEPFGGTLTIGLAGENFPFTVTGILKDLPSTTDIQFEFLIPWQFLESLGEKDISWGNNSVTTYVKVRDGADIKILNTEVKDIRKKHTAGEDDTEVFLYPFTSMHLYSRFENGVPAGGRIEIVRMLGILGVSLLAIACINFINLSTARAQKRSKEVAVRKVNGAYRHSLIAQFLCESIVIALVAGAFSLGAVHLFLPAFNTLVQQQLSLDLSDVRLCLSIVGFIVLVGILAGSYPALYLSSFRPVRILKGGHISASSRSTLRTTLVVFQFGFAVTLIISVIVIRQQITFVQSRDTGYSKDNLVYHLITGDLEKNYLSYKNELIQSGVALSITKTSSPITERISGTSRIRWKGKDPQDKTVIERFYVDEDIAKTTGITILLGRDMDLERFPSDSTAVLLNETAVQLMNFKNPIGEIIQDDGQDWHVVGVVKNFILTSPHQQVEPMVLLGSKGWFDVIHIRLNPANPVQENISRLNSSFKKYNPTYPFEYHFVDVEYERKFANLKSTLTITTVFSSIAIFIACLGLLGLSTYMIESRVKEIGIRKVLGGSVLDITRLLSLSSLKPILISIVLFSPLAWLVMRWWLQTFAYRIDLNVWIFIMGALTIFGIAAVTIGIQTIRAANSNPVSGLRNE